MFKVLLLSVLVMAANEPGSHVHGQARMRIEFEGKSGKIVINSPALQIYGFEFAAKSAKDKKMKEAGLQKLEDKISEMVVFDASLKCEIKKDIFEVDQRDAHSDVDAEFQIKCDKSPMGTSVTFNIQKSFPRIKTMHVDVLLESMQKSLEVQKNGDAIDLKQSAD